MSHLLNKLWNESPNCRKCGRVTNMPVNHSNKDDDASVQHLYPVGHPARATGVEHADAYVELWCRGCNAEDNKNNKLYTIVKGAYLGEYDEERYSYTLKRLKNMKVCGNVRRNGFTLYSAVLHEAEAMMPLVRACAAKLCKKF